MAGDDPAVTEAPETPSQDQPIGASVTEQHEEAKEPTVDGTDSEGLAPTDEVEVDTDDAPEGDVEGDAFTDVDLESLTPEVRERYQQMQADYTRKTQELAEQRRELEGTIAFVDALVADDPDDAQVEAKEAVFRALGEQLGYDIEDDGDDEAGDDEESDEDAPEFRDPRVDELLAERQAAAQAEAERQFEEALDAEEQRIESDLKALARNDGITELTEEELDLLFDQVLALPPVNVDGAQGPDIKGAYSRFRKALNANRDRWIQSKQADAAPSGSPGVEKPDLSTEEGRIAHSARAIEAARAAHTRP